MVSTARGQYHYYNSESRKEDKYYNESYDIKNLIFFFFTFMINV